MEFHGRTADLAVLRRALQSVADATGSTRGRAVVVTGRRRVGKSRLVQEFCDRAGVPYVIFQATRGRRASAERAEFTTSLAQSPLPGGELVAGLRTGDWNQALRALSIAVPDDRPSIVVLDEVPWLVEQDGEFEGALQTVWDRHLSAKPVLLLLVGSDLSVMQALQTYGRPFFGRAATMAVRPLHLADIADMTGLGPADAIDALLVTGGFPELVQSWRPGLTRVDYLRESLTNPLSPLLAAGELTLLGEFPGTTQARAVLEAVGGGERTYSAIARQAGGQTPVPSGSLSPLLAGLLTKRVLAVDLPLSTKADTKNRRYRIADHYLRFWLSFLQRAIPLVERGRGELALDRIETGWPAWRGRAVEPVIRESLARIVPDATWPSTEAVGGWWNRQNNPEIDLIGVDREPLATAVRFVGSGKWLENQPFGRRDYLALARDMLAVPGVSQDTPMVAVSRSGFADNLPLATRWGPAELVDAWRG